jgi:hypothetical protein
VLNLAAEQIEMGTVFCRKEAQDAQKSKRLFLPPISQIHAGGKPDFLAAIRQAAQNGHWISKGLGRLDARQEFLRHGSTFTL